MSVSAPKPTAPCPAVAAGQNNWTWKHVTEKPATRWVPNNWTPKDAKSFGSKSELKTKLGTCQSSF